MDAEKLARLIRESLEGCEVRVKPDRAHPGECYCGFFSTDDIDVARWYDHEFCTYFVFLGGWILNPPRYDVFEKRTLLNALSDLEGAPAEWRQS